MLKTFQDKIVLITGGSRGIGKACALRFAELGSHIILNYARNDEEARKTADQIASLNRKCLVAQANVGDPKALEELVEKGGRHFGGIDIAVHCAALGAFKPVHALKLNQWELSLDVNAQAFLILAQKCIPWMEKRGGGSLIGLSSLGANRFIPNYGAVGISKAALESLVRFLGVELAAKKIRVNCVSGGLVDTDAVKYFPNFDAFKEEVVRRTPAGRIGIPEDLAKVVTFLASEEASWIYGQTVVADGGLSLI